MYYDAARLFGRWRLRGGLLGAGAGLLFIICGVFFFSRAVAAVGCRAGGA